MATDKAKIKLLSLKAKKWAAFGSIILFVSWLSQNYFHEKWHGEVTKLETEKIGIAFNELDKNFYQTYLNHIIATPNQDTSSIAFAYFAYANYANNLEYMGIIAASDDKAFVDSNRVSYEINAANIKKWYQTKDMENLRRVTDDLSNWENNNGDNTIATYQYRLSNFKEKEDFWNSIYLVSYIIGAGCLAYSFKIEYSLKKND